MIRDDVGKLPDRAISNGNPAAIRQLLKLCYVSISVSLAFLGFGSFMVRRSTTPPTYPRNQKTLRPLRLEDMPNPLTICPPEATELHLRCQNGHAFRPPWTAKLPFEFAPIQSADGAEWVLSEVNVPCSICRVPTPFCFPHVAEKSGNIRLYGDESYQWDTDERQLTYVYTFFGANNEGREKLTRAVNELKKVLRPSIDPSAWPLHTQEVRTSRWRKRYDVRLHGHEIDAELTKLARIIGAAQEDRFIFVAIAPSVMRSEGMSKLQIEDTTRQMLITSAMLGTIDTLTKQGFSPTFALEQIRHEPDSKFLDYLTELVGRGLHHYLAFHYVSRGKLIGLPTQVDKSASPEGECADLVAYCARRYFKKQSIGRESEVSMDSFGIINWGAFSGARFGVFPGYGFPWQKFS